MCEHNIPVTLYVYLPLDPQDYPGGGNLKITKSTIVRYNVPTDRKLTKQDIEKLQRQIEEFEHSLTVGHL
jgi:hypothetical protein